MDSESFSKNNFYKNQNQLKMDGLREVLLPQVNIGMGISYPKKKSATLVVWVYRTSNFNSLKFFHISLNL